MRRRVWTWVWRWLWTGAVLAIAAGVAPAAPNVWAVDSLTRLTQTATGTTKSLALDAARGEHERAQVALRAGTAGGTAVRLLDAAGLSVTSYLEQWIYVVKGSGQWSSNRNRGEGPGWYPWGLIPYTWGDAIPLGAGVNQALWLDIYVPREAAPGLHTVKLRAGGTMLSLPVTVYNVTLPVVPALDSAIVLWNVRYDKQAEQLLLAHRLQAEYVKAPALAGQGVAGAGFWMGVNGTATSVARAVPTDAEAQAVIGRYPRIRLHSYAFDESPKPSAGVCAALLATHAVLSRHGISVLATVPPGRGYEGLVDIGVTMPHQPMWSAPVTPWIYPTGEQDDYSPKLLLDKKPVNFRLLTGFLPAYLGYRGWLYWAADRWNRDPWHIAENASGLSYPGEGVLVLPGSGVGRPETVLPTIPLELLGDGAEDYDLYALAVAAGKGTLARSYTANAGTSWSSWTREGAKVHGVHRALLKLLGGA